MKVLNLQCLRGGSLLKRIDANKLSGAAFVFKLNHAFDQRKQRVIFAATNVLSRLPLGASLPRKDVSTQDMLAPKLFQTQSL
jgi:hypothetical protein